MSEPLDSNLENVLKTLKPAAQVSRDQLLYTAGQASAKRRGWLWPSATAVMTATTMTLLVLLAFQPEPRIMERLVYVAAPPTVMAQEQPSPDTGTGQLDPNSYWVLREQILRGGVESLPRPVAVEYTAGPPQTLGSMMRALADGKDNVP